MNVLNATIVEVGETIPFTQEERFGTAYGYVNVKYNCYGRISNGEVIIQNEEDAKNVKVGDTIYV